MNKNRLIGFILRMISLVLLGLMAYGNSVGLFPPWASIPMLIVSFALFFVSTKMMR